MQRILISTFEKKAKTAFNIFLKLLVSNFWNKTHAKKLKNVLEKKYEMNYYDFPSFKLILSKIVIVYYILGFYSECTCNNYHS